VCPILRARRVQYRSCHEICDFGGFDQFFIITIRFIAGADAGDVVFGKQKFSRPHPLRRAKRIVTNNKLNALKTIASGGL
jgi:hypothetical protein